MLLSAKARYCKDGGADRQEFGRTTGSSALVVEVCLDPRGLGPGGRQAYPNYPIWIQMFCGEIVGQSALSDRKPETCYGLGRRGIMEAEFDSVERCQYQQPVCPTVIVFRSKSRLKNRTSSKSRRGRRWLRQQPAYWLWWVKPSEGSNPFPLRQFCHRLRRR